MQLTAEQVLDKYKGSIEYPQLITRAEAEQAMEEYAQQLPSPNIPAEESNTNSPIGSYHWFHTLMGRVHHIGEYLKNKNNPVNPDLIQQWGEVLYNSAKELQSGYKNKVSPENNVSAEERAKELYPFCGCDNGNCEIDVVASLERSAYLTGYKEALQRAVEFAEYCLQFDHTKQHGCIEWFVSDDLLLTTTELYQQYLQTLKK